MQNNETEPHPEQDEEKMCTTMSNHSQQAQSPTLLPSPVANVISLVTRSSSLYLQLGSFIGGLALDGARVTTLTGLELSRAVIEGILNRAGRDVTLRSTGEVGRAEAESILERSIATLHSTITAISFAASTGFYFSATALGSATDFSQQLLASLDSILGSTDSSRAISSIITLIRREFQNPATGQEGEKVGVADLLIGICGLALLQRWCGKITEAEIEEKRWEEVVWDVVVLDDGRRADVVGNSKALTPSHSTNFVNPVGNEVLEAIERESQSQEESDDDLPEINLKQRIMQSLPQSASISIMTETSTTKTVTVDITGGHPPDMILPTGVEIVEENVHHPQYLQESAGVASAVPRYRVVYKITKDRVRGTNIQSESAFMKRAVSGEIDSGFAVLNEFGSQGTDLPATINHDRALGAIEASAHTIVSDDEDPPSSLRVSRSRENVANQKRSRQPTSSSSSTTPTKKEQPVPVKQKPQNKQAPTKRPKPAPKVLERKSTFRDALKKKSGTTLSSLWTKDSGSETSLSKSPPQRPAWGASSASSSTTTPKSQVPVASSRNAITPSTKNPSYLPTRDSPRPPQRGNPNFFSSRDLGNLNAPDAYRSPSRTSYYSVHEQRRDSVVSHTDTYSIHSADTRPGSPTTYRTHLRAHSNLVRSRSEKNVISPPNPSSPAKNHRRSRSFVASIYTMNTNASTTSLVLASPPCAGAFDGDQAMETLVRTGRVGGLFPQHHLVRNITRFVRFASASYGSSFLRVMGIVASSTSPTKDIDTKHHYEHHSFSNHTQLPADTILLSSFVDPAGGTDSSGHTGTGVPMVHFVSLDHDSKAVVLTCRGTLGFEDVLADMTCDYDFLSYRGKDYSVHKGIHASARRLLEGGGGRVMATITAALEEFPDYGLVMCGHSLGGGVTALLAIMISEPSPDPDSTSFVTTSTPVSPRLLLTSSETISGTAFNQYRLPPGRPIHVYAYGPPATLSPSLRLATRGLITTIINGQDLVPYLSLGVLHDMQGVALAFKNDDSGAKGEVRARVWEGLKGGFADRWYNRSGESGRTTEDDQWAYSALKALRASMLSSKLVPPGEVFCVETMPVLQRDAFAGKGLGRPATRSVLRYIRDVQARFGEVRFGGSMLLDHSPGRYEASLGALGRGVLG